MKNCCSLILFLIISAASAADPSKPKFVFILADDMGWTGLSVAMSDDIAESKSDYYLTPHIEKLATQGMRFSRAYSPGSLCTPSRAAILTGKTPAELRMTTPGGGRVQSYHKLASPKQVRDLPLSETTIGELLQTEGYATAHLGKWHLGSGNPGQHGFAVHDGSTENEGAGDNGDSNPKDIFGLTDRAVEFMREQSEAGNPFYLQLSHYAVHVPVEALEASKNKFRKLSAGERHSDLEFAAMTYDFDTSVGMILSEIDALELADNTYVVLMSDNGASGKPRSPQNLPLNGGKGTFYEGGIRVPLIVRGPKIEANSFSDESVTGCDLLPTFCEWASVGIPSGVEGASLVPLLAGRSDEFQRENDALLFHYPHYGRGPRQTPQSAVIVGNYKLIMDLESETVQLFDLENDLSEKKDLAKSMPEKASELGDILKERLEAVEAQMPTENPDYDPDARSQTQRRARRS